MLGPLGGLPDNFGTFGRAFRTLPNVREGVATTLGPLGGPPDYSRTSRRES